MNTAISGTVRVAARSILGGDYSRARSELRGWRSFSVPEFRMLARCLRRAEARYGAPRRCPLDLI